ncbi:MAG: hypothetical protein WC677_03405 [Clostridia bacterium]|jgi:hypothetical protein
MADVFYYVSNIEVSNSVSCGLKLSEWGEKEVRVEGITRNCIRALLNPKDDIDKYKSDNFKCLRLDIKLRHCFVADSMLYRAGEENPEVMELYNESIVPAENYVFGTYRIPECLITSTVLSDQIEVLDKRIDLPILYDNSEDLYETNLIENYREEYGNFNDIMLYTFNLRLVEEGKVSMINDEKNGIAIFKNNRSKNIFTVKIPTLE